MRFNYDIEMVLTNFLSLPIIDTNIVNNLVSNLPNIGGKEDDELIVQNISYLLIYHLPERFQDIICGFNLPFSSNSLDDVIGKLKYPTFKRPCGEYISNSNDKYIFSSTIVDKDCYMVEFNKNKYNCTLDNNKYKGENNVLIIFFVEFYIIKNWR